MIKKVDLIVLCLTIGMILASCKPEPILVVPVNPADTSDTIGSSDSIPLVNPIDTVPPIDTISPIITLCDSLFWGFE